MGEFPTNKKHLTVVAVNVVSTLPTITPFWGLNGEDSARRVMYFSRTTTARMDDDNNSMRNFTFLRKPLNKAVKSVVKHRLVLLLIS